MKTINEFVGNAVSTEDTAENSDTSSNLATNTQIHTTSSVEISWIDKLVLGIFIAIVVGASFTILIFLIYGRHAAFVAGIFVGSIMVLGAIIMSIIDTSNDDSKWRKNDSRT